MTAICENILSKKLIGDEGRGLVYLFLFYLFEFPNLRYRIDYLRPLKRTLNEYICST